MSDDKHMDILDELKTFPKPNLDNKVQNQMHLYLEDFSSKYQKRKRWEMKMKKTFIGAITAVAILTLSIISYNTFIGKEKVYDQSASLGEQDEYNEELKGNNQSDVDQPLDAIDLKLGEHQVAMENLYFEIPMDKKSVFIDRRVEGNYTLVDIRDKKTNELLYRFGESLGNTKEKTVFREVESKKTNIKIKVRVEIDSSKGLITKIVKSKDEYTNMPDKIDANIIPYSRTDKFPVEEVSVLANIYLGWKNEADVERVYEGYLFGVIK